MTPQHIIEAALLSSRRPMPVREIRRLFDDRLSAKSVKEHLAELPVSYTHLTLPTIA